MTEKALNEAHTRSGGTTCTYVKEGLAEFVVSKTILVGMKLWRNGIKFSFWINKKMPA